MSRYGTKVISRAGSRGDTEDAPLPQKDRQGKGWGVFTPSNRRGGVHTKLLKSTDREDFWLVELCVRSLAPRPKATNTLSAPSMCHPVGRGLAPAVERNTLLAPSMCHPEQAKRVEPQAKRRGGCRVSGRRDLSWNYGILSLDPTSRYPHRCCYAVRLRAYRPPLRMTHRRYIFVFKNTPPFPPLKGEAKVITADENRQNIFAPFTAGDS